MEEMVSYEFAAGSADQSVVDLSFEDSIVTKALSGLSDKVMMDSSIPDMKEFMQDSQILATDIRAFDASILSGTMDEDVVDPNLIDEEDEDDDNIIPFPGVDFMPQFYGYFDQRTVDPAMFAQFVGTPDEVCTNYGSTAIVAEETKDCEYFEGITDDMSDEELIATVQNMPSACDADFCDLPDNMEIVRIDEVE
jgi:hypothetical protein